MIPAPHARETHDAHKKAYFHEAELANQRLLRLLPKDQCEHVFRASCADIGPSFLGFVHIYEHLAKLIPVDMTVIDFGCASAPQCFLFARHRRYIGVDLLTETEDRFANHNTEHYKDSIANWIEATLPLLDLNIGDVFAICSYVPPWEGDNMALVRSAFQNVFTYYPCLARPGGEERDEDSR